MYLLASRGQRERGKEAQRKYRLNNKDKINAYDSKRRQEKKYDVKMQKLKSVYGINPEEFIVISTIKNCQICGGPPDHGRKNLCIDHDHKTGKVRGMVCHQCNLTLGKIEKKIDLLVKMISYLDQYKDKEPERLWGISSIKDSLAY